MALSVKHAKVAATLDSGDGKVSSNAWNDSHVLAGSPNVLIGTDGTGTGVEVSVGSGLVYSAGTITNVGTASGLQSVASRTALAAVGGQAAGAARVLAESGREGTFIWSTANLSAFVTADASQGIYVAPASDTTGASGAWVRKYSGAAIELSWFGIVADNATDIYPAISSAFAVIQLLAPNGYISGTIYRGGPSLHVLFGTYYCSQTLEPLFTGRIYGDGGIGPGSATRIRFPSGQTALRLQSYNTSGATTYPVANHYSADNLVIEHICFLGPNAGGAAGNEGESHGIHCKRPVILRCCTFDGFEGDGFYNTGNLADQGIADECFVEYCQFLSNRNGAYLTSGDSNAHAFRACKFNSNRAWGYNDTAFLGNMLSECNFDSNGITPYSGTLGACVVAQGGFRYCVIDGQEVGASTNAPPNSTVTMTIAAPGVVTWNAHGFAAGTPIILSTTGALPTGLTAGTVYYVVSPATNTFQLAATVGGAAITTSGTQSGTHTAYGGADNTWWYYMAPGAPIGTSIPTWASSMAIRSGGPFRMKNANASNRAENNYVEGGQAYPQVAFPAMVSNGTSTIKGSGTWERNFQGWWRVGSTGNTRGLMADGDSTIYGTLSIDGGVGSGRIDVKGLGASPVINLIENGTTFGYLTASGSSIYLNGSNSLILRANGIDTFTINSTGANIASGKTLQYAGTAIISAGVLNAVAFPALTGDVTTSAGSLATTLSSATVVAKIAGQAIAPASSSATGAITSSGGTAGIGYATGAGGAVTQLTSRTTGVTLNKVAGAITLFSAAGAATYSTFTVTNSAVAATDVIEVSQKSGANLYNVLVTAVAAGSFNLSVSAVSGTATEAPVINFAVMKAVAA